jgi:hypothetical protein
MKKLLLFSIAALCLSGCADKKQYEQVVLEQMQQEKDIKDYKIAPEYMAKCVVDTTSSHMPGFFALDPARMKAYRNYAKMLSMSKSEDPKKTLEELRNDFGGTKQLGDAHAVYTESLMDCYTAILAEKPDSQPEKQ